MMKVSSLRLMNNITIREAQLSDCARILELMQDLAVFEGYMHKFRVGLVEIKKHLFEQNSIGVIVATMDQRVEGILVYFFQPFTYDLCPWLIIKELYVSSRYRSYGLGSRLLNHAHKLGAKNNCSKLKWEVLTDNVDAQRFYCRHGATLESDWRIMTIDI